MAMPYQYSTIVNQKYHRHSFCLPHIALVDDITALPCQGPATCRPMYISQVKQLTSDTCTIPKVQSQ